MKKYIKLIFMTMILFMVVGISNGSWNGYITVAPYGPQACEDYFTGFVYASVDEDFQQTSWV